MVAEYIYLLQEREFVNAGQPIYKIGKTKQENLTRFTQYPKGSKLILQILCTNCDIIESQLHQPKRKMRQKTDIKLRLYYKMNSEGILPVLRPISRPSNDVLGF
jgi:hypothetical protein